MNPGPQPAPPLALRVLASDYGLPRRAFPGLFGAAGGAATLAGLTPGSDAPCWETYPSHLPALVDNRQASPGDETLATAVFRPLTSDEDQRCSAMFLETTGR